MRAARRIFLRPVALLATVALIAACTLPATRETSEDPSGRQAHFLIPGAPGGGWDGTARGVGEALRKSKLVSKVSFENLS